jgi:hypothetical protein
VSSCCRVLVLLAWGNLSQVETGRNASAMDIYCGGVLKGSRLHALWSGCCASRFLLLRVLIGDRLLSVRRYMVHHRGYMVHRPHRESAAKQQFMAGHAIAAQASAAVRGPGNEAL